MAAAVNVPLFIRWDESDMSPGHQHRPRLQRRPGPDDLRGHRRQPGAVRVIDGHSLLQRVTRPYQLNEYWYDYPANGRVPTWAQIHDTHFAYVETYSATGALAFREYYNLDADPGENLNLLGDASTGNDPPASLLSSLASKLAVARTCAGATCP